MFSNSNKCVTLPNVMMYKQNVIPFLNICICCGYTYKYVFWFRKIKPFFPYMHIHNIHFVHNR